MTLFKKILAVLLAVLTTTAAAVLGVLAFPEKGLFSTIAGCLCLLVLVIIFIINDRHFRKGNQLPTGQEFMNYHNQVTEANEQAQSNPALLLHRMEKSLWITRCYCLLIILLAASLPFFFGLSAMTLFSLLGGYILCAIYSMLLQPQTPELPNFPISKDEYPELNRLAQEVCQLAGVTMPIGLYFGDESIGVSQIGNTIAIFLSPVLTNLLTRDEMKQVLLHEMGHIVNKDAQLSQRYQTITTRWNANSFGLITWFGTMLMTIPTERLQNQCALYALTTSRQCEAAADALVKERGDEQHLANALAKVSMLEFFFSEPCRELGFDQYQGEEPRRHLCGDQICLFYRQLGLNEPRWRDFLSHQLPAKIDTHPTFRQRLEHLGVTTYDVSAREPDGPYAQDLSRMREADDQATFQHLSAQWPQLHEEYNQRKELMDRFAATADPYTSFNAQELYDIANAYVTLDDDIALSILNHMLEQEPTNAYALSMKGAILLNHDDKSGVELLFQAADNSNFTDDAMEIIADYALKTGNQPLLDRYRDVVLQLSTHNLDLNHILFNTDTPEYLMPSDLDQDAFDAVLQHILTAGQSVLQEVLTVKKEIQGEHAYMYFLVFSPGTPQNVQEQVRVDIFRYLDMANEQFYLEVTDPKKKSYKRVTQAVKDCCIYRSTEL